MSVKKTTCIPTCPRHCGGACAGAAFANVEAQLPLRAGAVLELSCHRALGTAGGCAGVVLVWSYYSVLGTVGAVRRSNFFVILVESFNSRVLRTSHRSEHRFEQGVAFYSGLARKWPQGQRPKNYLLMLLIAVSS